MAALFIGLASLIHVYIFCLESLLWGKPSTNKTFGMTPEMAAHNRLFAFNQGFYNLFLALGTGAGLALGGPIGAGLMAFGCLSMVGAALVLLFSAPKLIKPVLVQGVPPLIGLILLAASRN